MLRIPNVQPNMFTMYELTFPMRDRKLDGNSLAGNGFVHKKICTTYATYKTFTRKRPMHHAALHNAQCKQDANICTHEKITQNVYQSQM